MEIEFFLYYSPGFKNFLKDNPHERGEAKFLESIVEEGMNVIDIGANIGITTVAIATMYLDSVPANTFANFGSK